MTATSTGLFTGPHDVLAPRSAPRTNARPGLRVRIAKKLVLARLQGIGAGQVEIEDLADGTVSRFGRGDGLDVRATIRVLDPDFWGAIVARGSVGAAESWIDGHWTCDDLTALVRVMVRNREVLDGMERGLARLSQPFLKLFHSRNANSKDGSRRNIAAHYDLGNDFFELFLDESLTYSCGVFEHEHATLHDAQRAKLDRLCRKLELTPDDHLLEIGTGWGSLAIHAAREYGCRVTTTTISKQQHEIAARRIAEAGLEDRITLLLKDYRDLDGKFDKLVSCEMVEAVGHDYLETFLAKCAELLHPHGAMAMQAILIEDREFDRAVREVDFIKRYVFPGSFIPSTTAIVDAATKASDLRLRQADEIGPHYVTTLRTWRENLYANVGRIRELGYDDQFLRLWEYYLCYCEGGFAERFLGVGQFLFTRPLARLSA
jgi:cyclopropane-fatty-acyl-phospholipid synthase